MSNKTLIIDFAANFPKGREPTAEQIDILNDILIGYIVAIGGKCGGVIALVDDDELEEQENGANV